MTGKPTSKRARWLGLLWVLAGAVSCWSAPELHELAVAPSFEMTDQRGEPFGSSHLQGRVWVANFIFTSCPDVCPVITQTLAEVQKALEPVGDSVHFVSISVDPEIDTPEVLAAFMQRQRLDASNWSFVTGSPEVTEQVVVEGFKQAQEEIPARDGEPRNIRHGSHFVLIDGNGTIRGFYQSRGDGPANLVDDANRLIRKDA